MQQNNEQEKFHEQKLSLIRLQIRISLTKK